MKKRSLTVLSLLTVSALTLLTSCADDKVDIIINETSKAITSEITEITDSQAEELFGGDYIASLDFTDCKIGLIECHGDQAEIVEYLSEKDTGDFVGCLKKANIFSVRSSKPAKHISYHKYEMLLNTGEEIYIGVFSTDILINGSPYHCDEESLNILRGYEKDRFDSESALENVKQVDGSTIKALDFTDCTVGVLDYWAIKIVGYMPNEMSEKLAECIKNADISADEDKDFTRENGSSCEYEITLSSGEKLYIGAMSGDLMINGVPYKCDEETLNEIRSFRIGVTYNGSSY